MTRSVQRSATSKRATPSSATERPPPAPPIVEAPVPPSKKQLPLYLSRPFVEAALVKGNFKTIVMLPKYVDIMEWVAVNGAGLFPSFYLGLSDVIPSFRLLYQPQRVLRYNN